MDDKTLVQRLRESLQEMASVCSVNGYTWNNHASNVLQAATRIEALEAALRDLLPEAINDRYITQSDAVRNAQSLLEGKQP